MDISRLHRMANQIAANFAALGEEQAVNQTAEHIRLFWDPRMKAQVLAEDRSGLSPVARGAIARLAA